MIKKIIKKSFILMLGAVILAILTAAGILLIKVDFSNPENLDMFVQAKIKKAEIPGISFAIIKNGKLDSINNYGDFDAENKKPVTENTLFQIASVSKTITATAVMQLYEKGLIKLDDDVNRYLPFKIIHPKFPDTAITFRMLLTHTSGIDNNWDVYESLYTIKNGGGDSPVSLEQFIKGFLVQGGEWYDGEKNFIPLAPGTQCNYSNPGYALLGCLVERITNMPFNEYCQENIFNPLEMNSSKWLLKETELSKLAIPYDEHNAALPHYSFPTYPDGSLKTSTQEYAHFILAILNGGKYNSAAILSRQSLEEMFRPQADENKQALAWSYSIPEDLLMKDFSGKQLVGHTGSDPGVFSMTLFNRDNKNGLILFMNKEIKMDVKTINIYLLVRRLIHEANLV